MNKDICVTFYLVFSFSVVVFSEANDINCKVEKLPWRKAMASCIGAGGTPASKNVSKFAQEIQAIREIFWTSDYTTRHNVNTTERADLCGFRNYNRSSGFSTERFWNCSVELFYICCPGGQVEHPLREHCIKNGTWEQVIKCGQSFYGDDFKKASPQAPNGFYWTTTAIELIQHKISDIANYQIQTVTNTSFDQVQNIYQCGVINKGGAFQYTTNCNQTLPSYCCFGTLEKGKCRNGGCRSSAPILENTSKEAQSLCITLSPKTTTSQTTISQTTISQTNWKMVKGVAVTVGVTVALTIAIIALIRVRRRGMICRTRRKETEAHANAAYGMANADVSCPSHAVPRHGNVLQHRNNGGDKSKFHDNEHHINARTNSAFPDMNCQKGNDRYNAVENALCAIQKERKGLFNKNQHKYEFRRAVDVSSRINKHNPKVKDNNTMAPYGKEKKPFRTTNANHHTAKGTTTKSYDNACFKESTAIQMRDYFGNLHEETDEYNTTCLNNIHLHHDSDYNFHGQGENYNVADICGNRATQVAMHMADSGTYNTLSNRNDDHNTANVHQDKAPHAALRSGDTYNTLRGNTDDYNVVDLNSESPSHLTMHSNDTYNTVGREREEYNTVDFHRTTDANTSEDCYDHLH